MTCAPICFSHSKRSRDIAFGQNGNGRAIQQRAIKRAAATVIARGRPGRLMLLRIEFAAHQARHQAAKGRADLVRAGGKDICPTSPMMRALTPVMAGGISR